MMTDDTSFPAILIVEDDPGTAELERRALARVGITAEIAASAAEADAALRTRAFRAVVLDYHLPDGDAWDIVALAHTLTPRVPVVLVTAVGNEQLVTEAIHRGVADYVRKSDDFWDRLPATIDRVVKLADVETRLRESEERFRGAFETAAHGMALVALDGRFIKVNQSLCRIVGYSEEDLLDADFQSITHPDDLAADLAGTDYLLSGGARTYQLEKRYIHRDGRSVWILLSVSLAANHDGTPAHFVSHIIDINDRKEAVRAMREAKEAADAANRAKAQFLARMSHEIRTPMNAVLGLASLLLDDESSEQKRRDLLRLQNAAQSVLALVNDILDLSKVEAGRLDIARVAMEPRAVIEDAVTMLRPPFAAKGLRLDVIHSDDIPASVMGDPARVRQIMLNFLGNALKFTASGGVTVKTHLADGLLRVDIEDTGVGIPAEQQARLFQDYTQADPSTWQIYGGTGLGLAICRHLAEAMGGTVGVASLTGQGSRFWFTIAAPACAPFTPPMAAPSAPPVPGERHGLTILVADDMPINQEILLRYLSAIGHNVTAVLNGREAVQAVRDTEFDLVLMDMEMPEMDGLTATREIRRLDTPGRDVAIVALTANAMQDDIDACKAAGMDDFLSKPVDLRALGQMIARLLTARRPS